MNMFNDVLCENKCSCSFHNNFFKKKWFIIIYYYIIKCIAGTLLTISVFTCCQGSVREFEERKQLQLLNSWCLIIA